MEHISPYTHTHTHTHTHIHKHIAGEGNGTSTLAWKIPRTEEPGRLQSMGSLRVGHYWATSLSFFIFMHWRRKWQPIPVNILAGRIPGTGEPGGLLSMGSHRVGHDWSDSAAASTYQVFWMIIINKGHHEMSISCFTHWVSLCKITPSLNPFNVNSIF